MIITRILNGIPAPRMPTPYGAGCMSAVNVQSGDAEEELLSALWQRRATLSAWMARVTSSWNTFWLNKVTTSFY